MWDIILVIIVALAVFGGLGFLAWQFDKEHKRKEELAKKNMSFLESLHLTGLPIITFHNNDKPINMVLDTGSNICIIDQSSLNGLNYEVSESKNPGVIGVAGEHGEGDLVCLPLKYKEYEFDFECCVVDMKSTVQAMKKEYGVTIHGILGTGFFTKYKYILDFNDMVAYSLRKD